MAILLQKFCGFWRFWWIAKFKFQQLSLCEWNFEHKHSLYGKIFYYFFLTYRPLKLNCVFFFDHHDIPGVAIK